MPLLSQAELFSKFKTILMMSPKILTCLYSFVSNFFFSFFFTGGAGGLGVGGGGVKQNTSGENYSDFLKWRVLLSCSLIIIKWTWVFFSQNLQFDLSSATIRHKRIIMKSRNFCDKKAALMMPLENLNYPYSRKVNFYPKNKAVLLMRFEVFNSPYYHELKFYKKQRSFVEVARKHELPLL